MINGIRITQDNTISDASLMAMNNSIDFVFLQARTGMKDNWQFAKHKAALKNLIGEYGTILVCPYTDLAYSPDSPSGSTQGNDLYALCYPAGEYQFHMPLGIMLTDQLYVGGNFYPLTNTLEYVAKLTDAIRAIKNNIGRNPILMSYPGFIKQIANLFTDEILECPFYIANWTSNFPSISPWTQYTFWEYSKLISWPGVSESVFNVSFPDDRGTLKNWNADSTTPILGGKPGGTIPPVVVSPSSSPSPSEPPVVVVCPDGYHWSEVEMKCVPDVDPGLPNEAIEILKKISTDASAIRQMIEAIVSGIKMASK